MASSDVVSVPVYLDRNGFGPFVALLKEHQLRFQMRETRMGVPQLAVGVIELLIGSEAMWVALAAVVVAYIKARNGRKVIITTKDDKIIDVTLEGLSEREVEKLTANVGEALGRGTKSLTALDPKDRSQ